MCASIASGCSVASRARRLLEVVNATYSQAVFGIAYPRQGNITPLRHAGAQRLQLDPAVARRARSLSSHDFCRARPRCGLLLAMMEEPRSA